MGRTNGDDAHGADRGHTKKLITQAVEAARDIDEKPPPELSLAWMCQSYPGSLPETGGILDQDFVLMTRMQSLSNIYNVVMRLRSLQGADIHKLTTAERRMIKSLREMGVL